MRELVDKAAVATIMHQLVTDAHDKHPYYQHAVQEAIARLSKLPSVLKAEQGDSEG